MDTSTVLMNLLDLIDQLISLNTTYRNAMEEQLNKIAELPDDQIEDGSMIASLAHYYNYDGQVEAYEMMKNYIIEYLTMISDAKTVN